RPPPVSGAVAPSISATAKWVSALMQEPLTTAAHVPITPAEPLLAAPPAASEPLAAALRESIARSGLFYESHLADWALQRCTREDLVREPQAHLPADVRMGVDAEETRTPQPVVLESHEIGGHES